MIILISSLFISPSPSSSSSLLSLLVSRSHSDEAVSMKAKPMKRDAFWGRGPWVSATSPDGPGRSVPLPEVLHTPTRWAEDRTTRYSLSEKSQMDLKGPLNQMTADCWGFQIIELFLLKLLTVLWDDAEKQGHSFWKKVQQIWKNITCMSEWNEILLSVIWLSRPF